MSEISYDGVFDFYRDRIQACINYGLRSGEEILNTIWSCAFNDSMLTNDEFVNIMNLCAAMHIKLMEANYNAGWNQ